VDRRLAPGYIGWVLAGDPSDWFVRSYPKFRRKRLLRFLFDHFQSDLAFNWLLATWPMRFAASVVYFHHKGVFDPVECGVREFASPPQADLSRRFR
jgi:hypothetical protein